MARTPVLPTYDDFASADDPHTRRCACCSLPADVRAEAEKGWEAQRNMRQVERYIAACAEVLDFEPLTYGMVRYHFEKCSRWKGTKVGSKLNRRDKRA